MSNSTDDNKIVCGSPNLVEFLNAYLSCLNSSNVCNLSGIACDTSGTQITKINLVSTYLSGTVPTELGLLTFLKVLNLGNNQLVGIIPSELSGLIELQILNISSNKLSGTIPSELSQLNVLTLLNLNLNNLTGTISSELSKLNQLKLLFLAENQLIGTIPSELCQLTALLTLNLGVNQLTGSIPSELSQLINLRAISFNTNNLTGTIPFEVSKITTILALDFGSNNLTGTIPSQLSQLINLEYLLLYGNQLVGSIPFELSRLKKLMVFFLHNNQLSGTIATELGELRKLSHFIITDNQLTGTFPTEICQLTLLQYLGLFGDKLTGTLPTQLSQLKLLNTLSIDSNLLTFDPFSEEQITLINFLFGYKVNTSIRRPTTHNTNLFSGSLPSEIGLMESLENIYIENNLITGSLPTEFGLLSAIKVIYLTTNQLSGSIPSQIGELKNLTELRLSFNQLSGDLPMQLGSLTSLINLYLSSNEFTGTIPSVFGELLALQQLQLSDNNLTGTITTHISRLTALQNFYVNTNQLIGTIPSELAHLISLQLLYFDQNLGLYGTVSNEMCLIQSLVLITVPIGVSCPTNCTSKCLKLKSFNPTIVPVYSPNISPTNLQYILTTNDIIGISIGVSAFIFIVLFMAYVYIIKSRKKQESKETDTTILRNIKQKHSIENTPVYSFRSYIKTNKLHLFNWNDFDFEIDTTIIGEGSFGIVIRSKLINSQTINDFSDISMNEDLAIKIIKMTDKSDDNEYENLFKEVQNHFDIETNIINKNCIVKLYGAVEGHLPKNISKQLNVKTALGIVMHYEAGGSLNTIFNNPNANISYPYENEQFPSNSTSSLSCLVPPVLTSHHESTSLSQKVEILQKIAQSLAELHRAGIVHGDLKPDNILLSSKDISQAEIRLADFGYTEIRENNWYNGGMSSLVNTAHQRGTPVYSAPEQLYHMNIKLKSLNNNEIMYAKPSSKTNMYSFAVIAWELLTQQKPFSNITTNADLSLAVHQGVRPDIKQLPSECPTVIRTMIERCWDSDRNNRLSAIQCFALLRDCFERVLNTQYDVYLVYKYGSPYELVIKKIKNQLIVSGLKVATMYDVGEGLNPKKELNKRVELIKQSKVIVLCLEMTTQTNRGCQYELGNNRGFKRPRPVIPLFLEVRNEYFPDDEIKVHCYMGLASTKVFDISSFISNTIDTKKINILEVHNASNIEMNNNPIISAVSASNSIEIEFGVDALKLELNRLVDHIYNQINELCVIE